MECFSHVRFGVISDVSSVSPSSEQTSIDKFYL